MFAQTSAWKVPPPLNVRTDFRMESPAPLLPHNAAARSLGLVTLLSSITMVAPLSFLVLLLALGCGEASQPNDKPLFEELKPGGQPSKYGSLWPLPQKVQISGASFNLPSSFRIVDGKVSYTGASCILLQNAYRRWETLLHSSDSFWLFLKARCRVHFHFLCVDKTQSARCVQGPAVENHFLSFSTDITTTYLALAKNGGWAKAEEPLMIPLSWRSCRCGSRHLTRSVTVIPRWRPTSHVSVDNDNTRRRIHFIGH